MKLRISMLGALLLVPVVGAAQFKEPAGGDPRISESMIQSSPSLLLGWFDPSRFQMHHAVSFSYLTAGGQGMTLGTYTNSMLYQFSDNLNAQADVSLSYMPTNSFARFGKQDLSNIYLSRAQINYRPWENMSIQVQYRAMPYTPLSSPWYNPWYREDGF
jgi:hypothetical protein